MHTVSDRRTRKRLATRQAISDVATRLFIERGFDRVTVDEIAEAADVGRMTVFNHFPRKEDLFFDREREMRELVVDAVRRRPAGTGPIEATRLLAHRLIEQRHSLVPLDEGRSRFVEAVLASEALRARARQMRDDVVRVLAAALAEAVDRPADDPHGHLAAGLITSTWGVAFAEAHAVLGRGGDVVAAGRVFLALIDRGVAGVTAAMAGTPYA